MTGNIKKIWFFYAYLFIYSYVTMQKEKASIVEKKSVSVILLAGGKGKRMGVSLFHIPFGLFDLRVDFCTQMIPL